MIEMIRYAKRKSRRDVRIIEKQMQQKTNPIGVVLSMSKQMI